jgi:hypothetical protein
MSGGSTRPGNDLGGELATNDQALLSNRLPPQSPQISSSLTHNPG